MREQYCHELDQMCFPTESKQTMIHGLLESQGNKSLIQRPRILRKGVAVAALTACLLTGTAGAITIIAPVVREYYRDSIGYQQSALRIGQSISKGGWNMTLTDCVWDNYNLRVGITLTAPEGTVLNAESGYSFGEWCGPWFTTLNVGGAGHYTQEEDNDPADNTLKFILWNSYSPDGGQSLAGQTAELTLGDLYHRTQWNEQKKQWEREYDCQESWYFQIQLPEKDYTMHLTPNIAVHTLDVDATLTQVNVSPFGVYLTIEGDSLKGHHTWVPKNAPDGWYGCIEYQEVVAWTKDGTAILLTDGLAGSGCSGGTDSSEPGMLQINRRFDELVDMESLDHLTVCGVDISLK